MRYKTIILELLQASPELCNRLQRQRRMLRAVEDYAEQLKTRHAHWQDQRRQSHPASNPAQIASEALELALAEVQHHLSSASGEDDAREPERPPSIQEDSPPG
jgi:nucleoid-associated protein YejK